MIPEQTLPLPSFMLQSLHSLCCLLEGGIPVEHLYSVYSSVRPQSTTRVLTDDRVVHHVNGDISDNTIDNLLLTLKA
jgi:hypothetical protein